MNKSSLPATKREIAVLQEVYSVTDCSNETFDWAMIRGHRKQAVAATLGRVGLLVSCDGCSKVDDDGFTVIPSDLDWRPQIVASISFLNRTRSR